jgi:putative salt-induced outer membrane protein YdiY
VDTTTDETEFQSTDEQEKLPSWFYSVGLDGTASSGNVNRQLLNLKTSLHFESPKSIFGFFTTPKFQYGTNSDVLQEREIFLDLNSTLFYLKSNLYVLIFGAFEQSNLRKISSRYYVGTGLGWKIIGGNKKPKSNIKMSISNAIVRENTDFEIKEDKDVFRNSTRLKLSVAFVPDKLIFSSVVFYQPSLTDNYYRWNSSSSLSYKVGKHLAILAAFENTYENFNVVGIKNSQTNTTIGLTYSGSN